MFGDDCTFGAVAAWMDCTATSAEPSESLGATLPTDTESWRAMAFAMVAARAGSEESTSMVMTTVFRGVVTVTLRASWRAFTPSPSESMTGLSTAGEVASSP